MWAIELSEEALRDLSRLENKIAERIVKKLEEAAKNPQYYFTRLVGHDDYKLRISDYRALVLLLHEKKVVFVQKICHRKNIYK